MTQYFPSPLWKFRETATVQSAPQIFQTKSAKLRAQISALNRWAASIVLHQIPASLALLSKILVATHSELKDKFALICLDKRAPIQPPCFTTHMLFLTRFGWPWKIWPRQQFWTKWRKGKMCSSQAMQVCWAWDVPSFLYSDMQWSSNTAINCVQFFLETGWRLFKFTCVCPVWTLSDSYILCRWDYTLKSIGSQHTQFL